MSAAAKRLEADRPELFEVPMGDSRRVGSGYELRIAAFTAVVYEGSNGGWHWGLLFGHGLVGSESDGLESCSSARSAASVLQTNLRRLQDDLAELVKP